MALNFEGCKIFSEFYRGRSTSVLLLLLFSSLYIFQMMENKCDQCFMFNILLYQNRLNMLKAFHLGVFPTGYYWPWCTLS